MIAKIKIKPEFDTLDKVVEQVSKQTSLPCEKTFNKWKTNFNQDQCGVITKSGAVGLKFEFVERNVLELEPVATSNFLISFTLSRGIVSSLVRMFLAGKQDAFLNEATAFFSDIQE